MNKQEQGYLSASGFQNLQHGNQHLSPSHGQLNNGNVCVPDITLTTDLGALPLQFNPNDIHQQHLQFPIGAGQQAGNLAGDVVGMPASSPPHDQSASPEGSPVHGSPMSRSASASPLPTGSRSSNTTFVHKLHSIVSDESYRHLITWSNHGDSFFVFNVVEFSRDVLPKYFKHNNFSSFVRQLNMYGFHKVSKSPRGSKNNENQVWEFSHVRFQRNRPDLLDEIKRKPIESATATTEMRRESADIYSQMQLLQTSNRVLNQRLTQLQGHMSQLYAEVQRTHQRTERSEELVRHIFMKNGWELPESSFMTHEPEESPIDVKLEQTAFFPNGLSPTGLSPTSLQPQVDMDQSRQQRYVQQGAAIGNITRQQQHRPSPGTHQAQYDSPQNTGFQGSNTLDISPHISPTSSVSPHSSPNTSPTHGAVPEYLRLLPNQPVVQSQQGYHHQQAMMANRGASPNTFSAAVNTPLPPSPLPGSPFADAPGHQGPSPMGMTAVDEMGMVNMQHGQQQFQFQ